MTGRNRLYEKYRQATIAKGVNPVGKKRFFGIIDTCREYQILMYTPSAMNTIIAE